MPARFAVSLALAGLFAAPAAAQQFDRRARDEPEVVIEAGGRVGTCDVVRFTPDGNFLLAAGDDKVVRAWPHSAAGLGTAPGEARTLRWRGWRDQRGGIKAVGPSPDGSKVAVGGFGLRVSTVAILDRETGDTLAITWPKVREGQDSFNVVTVVAYHPDGKRVAFGTADGSLWLWDPVKLAAADDTGRAWAAPVRVGAFAPKSGFDFPRAIHFPDANTLVAVARSGPVVAFDLTGKQSDDPAMPPAAGKTLFDLVSGEKGVSRVFQARWTADGKWLVAASDGRLVWVRSADGKLAARIELPENHYARSVAIHDATRKVAVAVGGARPIPAGVPPFYMEGDDELWVYDDPSTGKLPEPKKLPHPGRAEAMGFHPTADRLAVAGGDADEITLIDLGKTEKPVSVVRGAGRHLSAVNLSENGDILGVKTGRNPASADPNDRGTGPWTRFNLARFVPTADQNTKWVGVLTTAAGWSIVPDTESRFVWYAVRGNVKVRLGLDRDQDQAPTCFTFVPTPEGKPARVLIGHYYGCSLFELAPERVAKNPRTGVVELTRTKLFTGHGAEVRSIVADRKGEWFVTASPDQTVAGWSLADWKTEPALGAAFAIEDAKLTVAAVDVGSPAWESGLTKGDRIDLLAVDGKLTYDRRAGKAAAGTPDAALAALKKPESGVELFFGWTTPGQAGLRVSPTTLKQRPLWKWFPAFDDRGKLTDTVIWMWHGSYYYTASVHGDRLAGWHVNAPDPAGRPEFHALERYKHLFLRPDVIAKLLGTRSVAEAMKDAQGDNPQRRSFREVEPAPVELALKQATVRPGGVPIAVTVTPQGSNPDYIPDRVELWVNDHRYKVWTGKGKEILAAEVTVPADAFRPGENQITVLTTNPARGRAEMTRTIKNPVEPAKPNLHGLAVGINDYSQHRKAVAGARSFGDLGSAKADASAIATRLLDYRGEGKHFPSGGMLTLFDASADRKSVAGALDKIRASRVKPDDLLIVFFAGHGDLLSPNARVGLPTAARGLPADSGVFVFCGPDYAPARADSTSLSGEELFDSLAGVNCRKLVLLDTCHAGGAVEANVLRRFIPNGQGPLVVAACDQSEQSFEDEKLGHGVFTYAVLEALGPKFRAADADTDGSLTPTELYDYVARRVPELMRDVRPGNTQTPICFPHPGSLPRTVLLSK